eukprot:666639-Hanusia_phi.AAC.2
MSAGLPLSWDSEGEGEGLWPLPAATATAPCSSTVRKGRHYLTKNARLIRESSEVSSSNNDFPFSFDAIRTAKSLGNSHAKSRELTDFALKQWK